MLQGFNTNHLSRRRVTLVEMQDTQLFIGLQNIFLQYFMGSWGKKSLFNHLIVKKKTAVSLHRLFKWNPTMVALVTWCASVKLKWQDINVNKRLFISYQVNCLLNTDLNAAFIKHHLVECQEWLHESQIKIDKSMFGWVSHMLRIQQLQHHAH